MNTEQQPVFRKAWVDASQFHDLEDRLILQEIVKRVSRTRAQGENPVVLLDLDSTLYEVAPRSLKIFQEWLSTDAGLAHPEVARLLGSATHDLLGYSITDSFHALGLNVRDHGVLRAMADLKKFWEARFFRDSYLPFDIPYPGAAEFARAVHSEGAEIVYLTGRDEPNMGQGTRDNLMRDGFPWNTPRTHLLLKKSYDLPDLGHKQGAAEYVKRTGTLVASLENEPANLVALYDLFPEAMHVFVETVCSEHATLPRHGLYRIRSFSAE